MSDKALLILVCTLWPLVSAVGCGYLLHCVRREVTQRIAQTTILHTKIVALEDQVSYLRAVVDTTGRTTAR